VSSLPLSPAGVARWLWTYAVLAVPLTLLIGLIDVYGSEITQRTAITMLIDLVLVVGLYIFSGNTGILSFGHMSFMAVGAYVTALLTIPVAQKESLLPSLPGFIGHHQLSAFPAALVTVFVTGLFGLVLAIPLMRAGGLAVGLSMFAVLLIVYVVANNWTQVTRGRLTMFGMPPWTTMWSALALALAVIFVAYVFQESRVGLRLRASREDEIAARAIGVNVNRDRRIAFVLSAMVVGAGGYSFALFLSSFNADAFYLAITFLTIAMLVVGGINSLTGAVVGTVLLTTVAELLRRVEEGTSIGPLSIPARPGLRETGLAFVMLVTLIFRPKGLTGGREVPWPGPLLRRLRRSPAAVSPQQQTVGEGDGHEPAR
jgi:branched-chain amino acid transport system permease protein